ncbi:MAG: hypothetical protein ACKV2T_07260 [Kofleriaceae bacterium]
MTFRGLAIVLSIVGSGASCVSPDLRECNDGWICGSEGYVCDPRGGGCVLGDLVDACAGLEDGARCEVASIGVGTCAGGVCNPTSCGDGVVDQGEECDAGAGNTSDPNAPCRPGCVLPSCGDGVMDDQRGEVCDDGNLVEADGCRPDCGSSEVCGNGVIDFSVGELCDDTARIPGDGCSATCSPELPVWTRRLAAYPGLGPAVLDPARDRLVTFTTTGETHEWDGYAWRHIVPRVSPRARTGATMAYDPVHRVVLLFGGFRGQTVQNDLWAWDGFDWRQLHSPVMPPPRHEAALAFDPQHDAMLLFGGLRDEFPSPSTLYFQDTWRWDGTSWVALSPSTAPAPRASSAMTTDPLRGEILLFGGRNYNASLADTWVWDGDDWSPRSSATTPSGGELPIVFDPGLGRIVVGASPGSADRLWSWDGVSWREEGSPPVNISPSVRLALDPLTRTALLIHHQSQAVYRRDQASWPAVPSALAPSPRGDALLATWTSRQKVVLFGAEVWSSNGMTTNLNDTWEWDGIRWTLSTGSAPSRGTAMAEDPLEGVLLYVGPTFNTPPETWRYSERGWEQLVVATMPSQSFYGAVATYDRIRGVVVLVNATETWEWDGTGWSDRTPISAVPPARYAASLGFDERRGRTVLFGGFSIPGFESVDDTWEWDGTSWTRIGAGQLAPRPRGRAALAYDRDFGRLVLFGGLGDGAMGDAWDFDGTTWRPLDFDDIPSIRFSSTMAPDPRGGLMLFGGRWITFSNQTVVFGDTWRLGYGPDSNACASGIDIGRGAGCADPACWHVCSPSCPPGSSCPAGAQRCGNGVADAFETCRTCPQDVGACPPSSLACGDTICDPGEAATCPGDC